MKCAPAMLPAQTDRPAAPVLPKRFSGPAVRVLRNWGTVLPLFLAAALPGRLPAQFQGQVQPTTGQTQGSTPDPAQPVAPNSTSTCSDPALAQSPLCQSGADRGAVSENQVYVDNGGVDSRTSASQQQRTASYRPLSPVEQEQVVRAQQPTDFERLVRSSTGELLPVFGRDLFQRPPSTFAPADVLPAASDYILSPGDQILLRISGAQTLNSQLTVDSSGSIFVPRVGSIPVAGLRFDQLQPRIQAEVGRYFRNFTTTVNLGRLRSIQVYVVGEARQPGAYTVSSLSTAINALFASGGPNRQGSLRAIQVRRGDQVVATIDLYSFLLRGDKSSDVRLEQGDVLVIPPVGPQVALSGSVHHPAIYELRTGTTLADLLGYAGGLLATASTGQISLERIGTDGVRHAATVPLTPAGEDATLRDGDILHVEHITTAYQKTVTIRGNLANPGRFAWTPGMRLTDIIPDRTSLLTDDYWNARNRLGVPTPLFEPLRSSASSTVINPATGQPYPAGQSSINTADGLGSADLSGNGAAQTSRAVASTQALQNSRLATSGVTSLPITTNSAQDPNAPADPSIHRIENPVPEIDWSYAVIERLDPNTLKSSLVPFNLGRLVMDHDASQNLELQPGDIVTILSQTDIPVALSQQTKFVRLEGEVASAGVYSVQQGETLQDVVRRAGGLTPNAYLYGSSFLRDSARVSQQQRLDEYVANLSLDLNRSATAVAANASSTGVDPTASIVQQRALVDQLRALRATGRIVLEFQPDSATVESIPALPLENGDVFHIPFRPATVSVLGAVYGQNVFLYNSTRRVADYLALAGKSNRIADPKHSFVIRADGSVYSRDHADHVFSNRYDSARIYPGDTIVVPEKLIKPSSLRTVLEYSQVLSSFGIALAAISAVR